jgi:hypothetical protein
VELDVTCREGAADIASVIQIPEVMIHTISKGVRKLKSVKPLEVEHYTPEVMKVWKWRLAI